MSRLAVESEVIVSPFVRKDQQGPSESESTRHKARPQAGVTPRRSAAARCVRGWRVPAPARVPARALAPQFVTEFDASQTIIASAAPAVIAPLQDSGHFLKHSSRKPSSLPTPEEEAALAASAAGGPSFVLDTSTAPDNPSFHIAHGNASMESEKTPPPRAADAPS
ncbi:hypothetical protein GUJ93_ZPchr0006g46146 [Zizania palustris]|uniref:Uncharacterized protein n=1 Tax=Zizania palustris TaxID=103762 RepID=A0A8J5VW94_ZIZPA|nr:hypothetical protein GUJ93_ZPchr0006g46146 [Zizania palustris]